MILDSQILSLWFVTEYLCYDTIKRKNIWLLYALMKSNLHETPLVATPI